MRAYENRLQLYTSQNRSYMLVLMLMGKPNSVRTK